MHIPHTASNASPTKVRAILSPRFFPAENYAGAHQLLVERAGLPTINFQRSTSNANSARLQTPRQPKYPVRAMLFLPPCFPPRELTSFVERAGCRRCRALTFFSPRANRPAALDGRACVRARRTVRARGGGQRLRASGPHRGDQRAVAEGAPPERRARLAAASARLPAGQTAPFDDDAHSF